MRLDRRVWEKLRRWAGESPGRWLPAGAFGGVAGGCAAAWVLWGSAELIGGPICFPLNLVAAGLLYLLAAVGGYSFISSMQHVIRAIRYLRRPPVYAYYEPPSEKFPELQIIGGPFPGCGLVIFLPILVLGLVISVPWFWVAAVSVPPGRLLLAVLLGLPPGIKIARGEARREEKQSQP